MIERFFLSGAPFVIAFVLLLAWVSVKLLGGPVPQKDFDDILWHTEVHHVEDGQTVWSLSHKYCPETVDRGAWVSEVLAINGMMDSTVYPGQMLRVLTPAKEVQR